MAIGEFVSVFAQYAIIEISKKRDGPAKEELPSPTRAAVAAALAYALGTVVPLLAGVLIRPLVARIFAVLAATTAGLAGLGATGAYLGGATMATSGFRVVTYGVVRICAKVFGINVSSLA